VANLLLFAATNHEYRVELSVVGSTFSIKIEGQDVHTVDIPNYNPGPGWAFALKAFTERYRTTHGISRLTLRGGGGGKSTECVPGRYQDQVGQSSCAMCETGQYQDEPGQESCDPCKVGHQCSAGASESKTCDVTKNSELETIGTQNFRETSEFPEFEFPACLVDCDGHGNSSFSEADWCKWAHSFAPQRSDDCASDCTDETLSTIGEFSRTCNEGGDPCFVVGRSKLSVRNDCLSSYHSVSDTSALSTAIAWVLRSTFQRRSKSHGGRVVGR
jgi:hypothetical protein